MRGIPDDIDRETIIKLQAHVNDLRDQVERLEKDMVIVRDEYGHLKISQADMDEKLKKKSGGLWAMISEYGMPFVVWYCVLWVSGVLGIYTALNTGYIGWEDAKNTLCNLGVDNYLDLDAIDPAYGNLVIAIFVNEMLEPIRLPLALATIKPIVTLFRTRRGIP